MRHVQHFLFFRHFFHLVRNHEERYLKAIGKTTRIRASKVESNALYSCISFSFFFLFFFCFLKSCRRVFAVYVEDRFKKRFSELLFA